VICTANSSRPIPVIPSAVVRWRPRGWRRICGRRDFRNRICTPSRFPSIPRTAAWSPCCGGRATAPKAILLLAHLDVVEARREDWTRDPFTLVEEGGYFYGRGTFDDKSMAAVWVDTLVRLRKQGYKPKRAIKMALTCGEEAGSAFEGAQYLVKHERQLIDAAFALNEFAYGVWMRRDSRGHGIEAGEKTGPGLSSRGGEPGRPQFPAGQEQRHLSSHRGLTRLSDYEFPVQLNDTTRTYFSRMSAIVGGETGVAMKALAADAADAEAAATLSQDPRLNAIAAHHVRRHVIGGGSRQQCAAAAARANINCRIFPGVAVEDVRRRLEGIMADPRLQ